MAMNDESQLENGETKPEKVQVPAPAREKAILFLVMGLVLAVDYITKIIIESSIELYTSWAPIPSLAPLFRITHVSNTGAAFGLFPDGNLVFGIVAVVVAIIIIIFNNGLPAKHHYYRIALGLMMGGALGNLLSRLRIGHVTDFFDFGPWPVFNIADLCIVTGVVLLAFILFREQSQVAKQAPESGSSSSEEDAHKAETGNDPSMLWND